MQAIGRPILRYHGGKWKLAPWVISHFPPHRNYVEPFGGGGSVLVRKPRTYGEVYNDLDAEVVNVFRCLQDPVTAERLRRRLSFTPFARSEFRLAYEPAVDPVDAAAYYRHDMDDAQHERLAEFLRTVQGMVVLSGYASSLYDDLYAGWARVAIEHMADGGRPRLETLWLNPAAASKHRQAALF